jgi:hypothetical protein
VLTCSFFRPEVQVKEGPVIQPAHFVVDTRVLDKKIRRDSKCNFVKETQLIESPEAAKPAVAPKQEIPSTSSTGFGFEDIPSTARKKRQRESASDDPFGFNSLSSKKAKPSTSDFNFDDLPKK